MEGTVEVGSVGVLSGPGAEGDALPRVAVGCAARQVQDHAPDGDADVGTELEQAVAQPCHLGTGATWCARRAAAVPASENVGGGGHQDAQLVGPDAAATGAVELQTVEQFLDAVLDVAAGAIHFFVSGSRSDGRPAVPPLCKRVPPARQRLASGTHHEVHSGTRSRAVAPRVIPTGGLFRPPAGSSL